MSFTRRRLLQQQEVDLKTAAVREAWDKHQAYTCSNRRMNHKAKFERATGMTV